MQILCQADLRNTSPVELLETFWAANPFNESTQEWATELASRTWSSLSEVDSLITEYAIGWRIDRINPIDKAVLRIAFYELTHTDLSPNIVINEAVEICKKYSTDESPRFVNGILGNYANECLPASSQD